MAPNFIDSIEKLLRYVIPGVAFFLLFDFYYPEYCNKAISRLHENGFLISLAILTVGISIYMIHKIVLIWTLEQLAYYVFNCSPVNHFTKGKRNPCSYSKAHAELIVFRQKSKHYPTGYSLYLWASIHYSLIVSELLIFFGSIYYLCPQINFRFNILLLTLGSFVGIFSIATFYSQQLLEKNLVIVLERMMSDEQIVF